jgi:ribonucleotide reductase, class II
MSFPESAPSANPVFFRTYSRQTPNGRESWDKVCDRTIQGLIKLGHFTPAEAELVDNQQRNLKCLTSGRWLWVGGTPWIEKPENFPGCYNCSSTNVVYWDSFGLLMNLAMMGCGTGAVLEPQYISQLPPIVNRLEVTIVEGIGTNPERNPESKIQHSGSSILITVGDSREGWVLAYQALLEIASDPLFEGEVHIDIDLGNVRPAGEKLRGFGGTSNPIKLPELFGKCAKILNGAVGRNLTALECCKLIDEAALVVVAGNIRRCLPEDALVHTNHGLVPIKDIQIGDMVQTPIGFRKVVNKFDQGIQDVYEIQTNSMTPRATLNHRVAVFDDANGNYKWKAVQDLVEGDRLCHNTQVLPGSITHLPVDTTASRPENSRNAKDIVIPDLSPDIAWLIGYTHGNGYVSVGRNKHGKPFGSVSWSMNAGKTELQNAIQDRIDRALLLFGLSSSRSLVKNENTAKSVCSCIRLAEYFLAHIKQPKTTLSVPDFILQGTVDIRAAYLAGLVDSDGSIKSRPPHLVTTVYPSFARQIGCVLSSLGIAGRTRVYVPDNDRWQIKHSVTIPALKGIYNAIIAPHSLKGKLKEGLKMNGFTLPGEMMRESYTYSEMQNMGFQGSRKVCSNYERYRDQSGIDIDIPVTVKAIGGYNSIQTYDIEVDEAHCFYCDGYLTHNSAGIRQFSPDDEEAALAKFGLWIQDDDGNWKIDPERDALRMANHTRVFHAKPNLDTIIDSVQKQFYSGEGAIQYAPEAIARASVDLLNTPELKSEFLKIYTESGRFAAQTWLTQKFFISMDDADDRLKRYGLNPCVVGETKVLTRNGYLRIDELCHREVEVWNGFEWSTVAPEITGYNQEIMRVELSNGSVLRCTPYHKFHLAVGKTGKTKIVEAKDLAIGDKLIKHELPVIEKGENYPSKQMYTQGFHQADGLTGVPFVRLYGVKMELADKMLLELKEKHNDKYRDAKITCPLEGKDWVPFEASLNERLEWLAGLIDGDGSAMQDGSVHISSINKDFLFNTLLMLQTCGINSKVRPEHEECDKLMPDGRGGSKVYHCQASLRLCISSVEVQKLLSMGLKCYRVKLDGFNPNRNASRHITVESLSMESELADVYCFTESKRHLGMFGGVLTGQCGEIVMSNNFCNLAEVHLNQLDPKDLHAQKQAFQAGALSVAALLNHRFTVDRYQQSREADPIVGVSFTGLFDFFVHAFGPEWLQWWAEGRTDNWNIQSSDEGTHCYLSDYFRGSEISFLTRWRRIVEQTVWEYCDRHGLKRPNRCTTTQPAGCLTADAVRVFDQGLLFADEHMEESSGDINLSEFGLSVREGIQVHSGIANPQMDLLRVTLANGRQITMTPDHRVSVNGSWVKANELKAGQIIEFALGKYQNAEEAFLEYVGVEMGLTGRQPRGCLLPSRMSSDLAYFIGALFGNGSFSEGQYRIRFSHGNVNVLNKLSEIGLRLFGIKGLLRKDGLNKYELCFSNKQLYLWFLHNEIHKPAKSKYLDRIPQKVRMSSTQSILAFFSGLIDTDGCIRTRGSVSIDSSSEAFIRHLQQIGECVGLCFSVFHNTQGQNLQGEKNMFGLCLSRMISLPESLLTLNQHSIKAQSKAITPAARSFKFSPYQIDSIEEVNGFTYDYAVDGIDDDDSWYWQGALKSHNSKSLLTGASPGWHPPKAARFLRRITFSKNDPVALACLDYGYPIVPSQSDTDSEGHLLNDPFDDRCTEWLVEIPTETSWAKLPGADQIDISRFSATAQFDFYMQVQRYYASHNVSATLELREDEIEPLAEAIHTAIEKDQGYISSALLARFDNLETFPRLPFEPISKEEYDRLHTEVLARRKSDDFDFLLAKYDRGDEGASGPAGCDSDKCLFPVQGKG